MVLHTLETNVKPSKKMNESVPKAMKDNCRDEFLHQLMWCKSVLDENVHGAQRVVVAGAIR